MTGEQISRALKDQEQIDTLMRAMAAFNQKICDSLVGGQDFTHKLTVRGDRGQLLQCSIDGPEIWRPAGKGRGKE